MYHFIVNPNSRSGLGLSIWKRIESELVRQQIIYRVHFTKCRGHATRIVATLSESENPVTLVVLGGDGSVDEVINGIRFPDKVTLGYIPIGSGNDFARGLHFPSDCMKALNVVLHSDKRRPINIGLLQYREKSHRFAVSSGIGYDAAICHQICVSKLKKALNKLGLGKLAYVGLSLDCLYHCRPGEMSVTLDDGQTLYFEKTYFAAAFNLPYEGGGCKFCPDAKPDDDLLDLIVIADVPKIQALAILPMVFSGNHTRLKGVNIYRCQKAQIKSVSPLPVHSDGEPIFLQRNITFSLEPEYIKIITP